MNSQRDFPIALPLRNDGRIFISGGTSKPKYWVELYDSKKGTVEGVDLPAEYGSPYASSCFQYTDKEVVVLGYYPKENIHSLLLYNLDSKHWSCVAKNVPIPIFQPSRRNLVYVGGDILFIIDHACLMYVYDLSSKKKVGEVGVVGLDYCDDDGVLGAFYAGDTDVKCTSWIFYLFLPYGGKSFCDLQYAKVEVVQGKDGVYAATVQMEGVLKVGCFRSIYIIADREIAKNEVKTNALVGKDE